MQWRYGDRPLIDRFEVCAGFGRRIAGEVADPDVGPVLGIEPFHQRDAARPAALAAYPDPAYLERARIGEIDVDENARRPFDRGQAANDLRPVAFGNVPRRFFVAAVELT